MSGLGFEGIAMNDAGHRLRWRSLDDGGLEHCVVKPSGGGQAAEGVVIGGAGASSFGVRYRIVVDGKWVGGIRSVHVTCLGGATVALRHDGFGEWTDGAGARREELSGACDLELIGSAFWPTPVVLRRAWKPGRPEDVPMVSLALPSLRLACRSRKFTAIESGRLYRMESAEPAAAEVPAVEIALDPDGFVTRIEGRLVRVDLPEQALGE